MGQGLQCWDSSGNLVVDIGDYNIRYVGSVTVTFSSGDSSKNISWSGMTRDGWFAAVVSDTAYAVNEYYCRPYSGGFTVYYLPTGGSFSNTLTIHVYYFL